MSSHLRTWPTQADVLQIALAVERVRRRRPQLLHRSTRGSPARRYGAVSQPDNSGCADAARANPASRDDTGGLYECGRVRPQRSPRPPAGTRPCSGITRAKEVLAKNGVSAENLLSRDFTAPLGTTPGSPIHAAVRTLPWPRRGGVAVMAKWWRSVRPRRCMAAVRRSGP